MKVRASRLPLAMICPASMQSDVVAYDLNDDGEPARLGTAVHEWLATRIRRPEQFLGEESFEQLAIKYSLEVDEVRALSLKAWSLWQEVRQWFTSPEIELAMAIELPGLGLTGHCDVVSYQPVGRTVHVNDHKTGFLDSDHSEQVKAYGLMALQKFPEADRVHTCVMRVRDYVTDHATYSREDLVAWADRVRQRLVDEGQTYSPGRHCSYCPRRLTCAAFRDWIQFAVEVLSGETIIDLIAKPAPDLVRKVYDARSVVTRLAKEAQEVLRTLAEAHGGKLERDDGYDLQVIGRITRGVLFREAWPILSEKLSADVWNSVFAVRKGALVEAIKAQAGHGAKKEALAEVMSSIEAVGGILETDEKRMELRKRDA